MSTEARAHWKAVWSAARWALPRHRRADLAFDRVAPDWTKTPRAAASELLRHHVERVNGNDYQGKLMEGGSRRWQLVTLCETALRPVEPLRQTLGENVLNGFGMFSGYRAPPFDYHTNWPNNRYARWLALQQRRYALIERLKARGIFVYDGGRHIRRWPADLKTPAPQPRIAA